MPLSALKQSSTQAYSLFSPVVVVPIQFYTLTCSAGQGKQQTHSVRIDRQILVREPEPAVVKLDCPLPPAT